MPGLNHMLQHARGLRNHAAPEVAGFRVGHFAFAQARSASAVSPWPESPHSGQRTVGHRYACGSPDWGHGGWCSGRGGIGSASTWPYPGTARRVDRLPEQPIEPVDGVPALTDVAQRRRRRTGQSGRVIGFVHQQRARHPKRTACPGTPAAPGGQNPPGHPARNPHPPEVP